jgi:valyl-tRNA synthetase
MPDNKELPKTYNPKKVENRIYQYWEKKGYFKPQIKESKKPYTIVIPPPNVTGSLHMGHALNNTLQDILIRRARMQGKPTLWLPGIDHAGIATQNVVEKQLQKEGKSRQDLGREKFTKRVWEWVDEYGHIIIDQLKKMGCSCDWSRQRFTMDKDYSAAINAAFKHYYEKGLIYQGERVINWCPRCQTALSDIEVEYKEQPATLYYFKYDKNFPITIATTRPETKLGDTAVVVNPDDDRYKEYIGKTYKAHFAGKDLDIKIIVDKSIDPKFGSGAVGITPAHSLADAELAAKNNLPQIKIIDEFGKMTKEAGADYRGLKAKEAQEKVIEWLKDNNLIEKKEEITNNLSVCYRCGKELEPQPSKQWFLKMSTLIKPAIEAIEKDKIKLTPTRWKKVYLDWMKNIKDWCISRQIWWGHRLPVWEVEIKDQKSKIKNPIYVGDNPPTGYEQVEDVLDTWFSSALWPFAALGWPRPPAQGAGVAGRPKKTDDLAYFYPTSILSTARDINMLWVVRMIFSGYEFMAEKPFSQVYIHPTVFNKDGKRMSKSLGTGVDPLELMEKYSADAIRFGLTFQTTGTQDIKFDENTLLAGKKFANKIWNMARFIIMNLENSNVKSQMSNEIPNPKTEADKKIQKSLINLVNSVNFDLDAFRFGQALHSIYDFTWHNFADIYIEKAKEQLNDESLKVTTQNNLYYILTVTLKLLHPFMPHLTEEIWQKLPIEGDLIISNWPRGEN